MRTRALTIAALCALPIACSGGGSGEPVAPAGEFQYRSSEDAALNVTVTKYGLPVAGASISVVEELSSATVGEADGNGTPYFVGGTGENGVCESIVSIPTQIDRVDVVVHHDGSRGPYGDEALRAYWGAFAPSSRMTVRVADLGNLRVELEDR